MKKFISLFVIGCLLLTGCKNNLEPNSSTQQGEGPSSTLNLLLLSGSVSSKPIAYTADSHPKNPTPIEVKMMSFLKKHRNVTIQITTKNLVDSPGIVRSVCFQDASKTNYDIIEMTPHQADICGDILVDLSPFIETEKPEWNSGDYRNLLDQFLSDGHPNMLPIKSDVILVAYNKKIFNDLNITPSDNWTWEQFADVAKKLRDNGYIAAIEPLLDRVEPIVEGFGGSMASRDSLKATGFLDSDETKRAFQQVLNLPVEWNFLSDLKDEVKLEKLGLIITWSVAAQSLFTVENNDFDTLALPVGTDGKSSMITEDMGLVIPQTSHHAKLAWELLHHLIGDTDDEAMSFVTNNTLAGFQNKNTDLKNNPLRAQLRKMIPVAQPSMFQNDLNLFQSQIWKFDPLDRMLQGEDIAQVLHESATLLDDNMEAFYKQ